MSDTDTMLWALSTAGTEALEERPASAVPRVTAGPAPRAVAHVVPAAPAGDESDPEPWPAFYGPI